MTLEKIQKALENLIAMFDEGVPECEWDMVKSDGRQALTELNAFIARLESEGLVDEVSASIEGVLIQNMPVEKHPDNPDWLGINGIITKSLIAKATINVIKENQCSTNI